MNILATIAPKSDQLNADDLLGRTMTIKLREVSVRAGEDQPVSFFFEGDDGKPFKPCKSMRRVVVKAWGPNVTEYVGRSMTIYCDESVQFGGQKVGGIRISHLSDIPNDMTMALTVTRANRKPYTVKALTVPADAAEKWASSYIAKLDSFLDIDELTGFEDEKKAKLLELKGKRPDQHKRILLALSERYAELTEPTEGKSDEDHGDQFDEPELWRILVGKAIAATKPEQIQSVQDEFDAREGEVPVDRRIEVLDAVNDALERLGDV